MSRNGKVIVAMSGGVDSSVAACRLKEQGYDCIGVFMWIGTGDETAPPDPNAADNPAAPAAAATDSSLPLADEPLPRLKKGCCSLGDACDARAVAAKLGIPFYSVNFRAEFGRIIDYFVDEYARARTPNPCVVCNTQLKFGRLLQYADMVGAEYVATGHYARIVNRAGRPHLARALNRAKDQSYVLFGIARGRLARCLFPVGDLPDKAEVRRIAQDLGLRVHAKPDSQEICFVPNNDYKELVAARRPQTQRPGDVLDSQGRVVGRHEGIVNYTIGQRRGLGIAAGSPIYVTRLDAQTNTVTVGPRAELLSRGLVAEQVNWLSDPPPPGTWTPAAIQIRYQHTPTAGEVRWDTAVGDADSIEGPQIAGPTDAETAAMAASRDTVAATARVNVRLHDPQPAVTPGQATVFYDGDVVLGGGWIARAMGG